jgi:predicted O-methyltransferase YrrM
VYRPLQLAGKYIRHYIHASNGKGHGMHSPFVFDFVLNVLNNKSGYKAPREIEELRNQLLSDETLITVDDMGAGSRTNSSKQRTVGEIAGTALKSKKLAQLLFRLVKHYHPKSIVELGTSLGITTAYFSRANEDAKIMTIEGSRAIANIARQNFRILNCNNIHQVEGNFDLVLPPVLAQLTSIDLGYVDGNHRYQPTINYFHQFLSLSHKDTILVFDDIHWSAEMEQAWDEIRSHPSVKYSIDLFFLGFIFFREEFKVRQDFVIRL